MIKIGIGICRAEDPKTGERVLEKVEDKVVQDFTGEEGTGIWSNTESVEHHIPAPTLSTAHFLRLASAERHHRELAQKAFAGGFPPQQLDVKDKSAFLEDLRMAVYSSCLAAYVQGINIIDQTNRDKRWNINFREVLQIWRAGCIIQADYIADMLQPIFDHYKDREILNLLFEEKPAREMKKGFPSLKRVVAAGVTNDHVIPAMSASLEYIKYSTSLGRLISVHSDAT